MGFEPVMVKVLVLDPNLKRTYGPTMHVDESRAIMGEQKGKWKIVGREHRKEYTHHAITPYETTVMEAEGHTSLTTQDNVPMLHQQPPVGVYAVKGQKKTKVAWLQDGSMVGGAEISGAETVKVGRSLGYEVTVITPKEFNLVALDEADMVVINNFWNFSKDQTRKVLSTIYIDLKPYVKYEHDYRELDRENFSRRLFGNSRLNVFLSPQHLKDHCEALDVKGITLPLAFDVDFYKPVPGVIRNDGTALVPHQKWSITWAPLQTFIKERPDLSFTILDTVVKVDGPNVRYKNPVPHSEMPRVYSEYEYVVHLPDRKRAGERVIFEAALCGCKVITNENSGHKSWGVNFEYNLDDLSYALRIAPYTFWKEADHACLRQ